MKQNIIECVVLKDKTQIESFNKIKNPLMTYLAAAYSQNESKSAPKW